MNVDDYILHVYSSHDIDDAFDKDIDVVDALLDGPYVRPLVNYHTSSMAINGMVQKTLVAELWLVTDVNKLQDAVNKAINDAYVRGVERGLSGD